MRELDIIRLVGIAKDIYEIMLDLAGKVGLPNEISRLRVKIEQLELEHEKEVCRLEREISDLNRVIDYQKKTIEGAMKQSDSEPDYRPGANAGD